MTCWWRDVYQNCCVRFCTNRFVRRIWEKAFRFGFRDTRMNNELYLHIFRWPWRRESISVETCCNAFKPYFTKNIFIHSNCIKDTDRHVAWSLNVVFSESLLSNKICKCILRFSIVYQKVNACLYHWYLICNAFCVIFIFIFSL